MASTGSSRALILAGVLVGLVVLAVAGFLFVASFGANLPASAPTPELASGKSDAGAYVLPHVLLALVVIVVGARALGAACTWMGQPPVIGEVLAGILLGPSCFGAFAPAAAEQLFSPRVTGHLDILAQLGVILYL